MRKFIIQSIKGTTTVQEVEVRHLSKLEVHPYQGGKTIINELYELLDPKSLAGERYYDFAFYQSEDLAMQAAKDGLVHEASRTARKAHVEVDQAALDERLQAIKLSRL